MEWVIRFLALTETSFIITLQLEYSHLSLARPRLLNLLLKVLLLHLSQQRKSQWRHWPSHRKVRLTWLCTKVRVGKLSLFVFVCLCLQWSVPLWCNCITSHSRALPVVECAVLHDFWNFTSRSCQMLRTLWRERDCFKLIHFCYRKCSLQVLSNCIYNLQLVAKDSTHALIYYCLRWQGLSGYHFPSLESCRSTLADVDTCPLRVVCWQACSCAFPQW